MVISKLRGDDGGGVRAWITLERSRSFSILDNIGARITLDRPQCVNFGDGHTNQPRAFL